MLPIQHTALHAGPDPNTATPCRCSPLSHSLTQSSTQLCSYPTIQKSHCNTVSIQTHNSTMRPSPNPALPHVLCTFDPNPSESLPENTLSTAGEPTPLPPPLKGNERTCPERVPQLPRRVSNTRICFQRTAAQNGQMAAAVFDPILMPVLSCIQGPFSGQIFHPP